MEKSLEESNAVRVELGKAWETNEAEVRDLRSQLEDREAEVALLREMLQDKNVKKEVRLPHQQPFRTHVKRFWSALLLDFESWLSPTQKTCAPVTAARSYREWMCEFVEQEAQDRLHGYEE